MPGANIVTRFEPGQLVHKGTLDEKLHDVKLFSSQYPEGLSISENECIRIMDAAVPRGFFNRNRGQTVEGKIEKFLYTINRNDGEVKKVYGIKLKTGEEIVFAEDAYSHQASTDFESVEIVVPCANGGKRRKHKSIKRRRTHKRKTHRRHKY